MTLHGLPETFWVVTRPTEASELADILFQATFEQLMRQTRGGLQEKDIVGIYADENEAREVAAKLVGEGLVRTSDCLEVKVLVSVQIMPTTKDMTAKTLADAAVEAVENAVRYAEQEGFTHPLEDEVSIGVGEVELHNQYQYFG